MILFQIFAVMFAVALVVLMGAIVVTSVQVVCKLWREHSKR
jgi:hypothetical protein